MCFAKYSVLKKKKMASSFKAKNYVSNTFFFFFYLGTCLLINDIRLCIRVTLNVGSFLRAIFSKENYHTTVIIINEFYFSFIYYPVLRS